MRPIYKESKVNYVEEDGKIRTGVPIRDIVSPTSLHLLLAEGKIGENGIPAGETIALAEYNEDKKTKNTWHFADDPAPTAVAAPKPAPFTPGGKQPA
jgi:hypothetical protein